MLTCHLRVFFEEVSLQVFDPSFFFFGLAVHFLTVEFRSSFFDFNDLAPNHSYAPPLYHGLIKGFPKQRYFSPLEDF